MHRCRITIRHVSSPGAGAIGICRRCFMNFRSAELRESVRRFLAGDSEAPIGVHPRIHRSVGYHSPKPQLIRETEKPERRAIK